MIMGRRTWQSLPGLLPGRKHIVLTGNHDFTADGCEFAHSFTDALRLAGEVPEAMVIGGAALYQAMLPYASRMYLTLIHAEIAGDTLFPEFDKADWRELTREEHLADPDSLHGYTFQTLERVDPPQAPFNAP